MSLAPAYIPMHGSLADRVVEWFKANSDEELTRSDGAQKFGVLQSSIPQQLALAVQDGRLQWQRPPYAREGAYRLGISVTHEVALAAAHPPAPAIAASDLVFSISPDRCIAVSFIAPGSVDPRMVLGAMLAAAAITIGKTQ